MRPPSRSVRRLLRSPSFLTHAQGLAPLDAHLGSDTLAPTSDTSLPPYEPADALLRAHYALTAPLQRRVARDKELAWDLRRRAATRFPQSSDAFHGLRDRDVKRRAARVLFALAERQADVPALLAHYGWNLQCV
jgi:hypothetical protein